MKLVIGKQFHESEIERIRAFQPDLEIVVAENEEDLKREISDATILLSRSIPEGIEAAEQLKWIQFTWEGVDHFTDAFMESDILLTNAGGAHSLQMAEHVFSYLLTIARKVPMYLDLQKQCQWLDWMDQPHLGRLHGSTIGILGYGRIGKAVASIAKGFGMNVLVLKRDPKKLSDELFFVPL